MKKARILIAEDEAPVAGMLAISLKKLGHEIAAITAYAHEAIDLAERLRPDLVLMDIDLADEISGIEAARTLREKFALPSIFLTGHADVATMQRAMEAEPFGYLVKPFEEFELRTTLETALRLRAVERRLTQFSRAVEQSPASIVITDLTGCIQYVNPRFTEITGYTAPEVIGRNPRVLKSGAHPAEFYGDLWKAILTGHEWRGELCNQKKNGELYWGLASISPIRDDAGRITHFVSVKEDITGRKQAEDRLRESEALNRTVIENVGEGIGIVDLQEKFFFANPAAEKIFGVPAGRLVGRNLREFTQPGHFEAIVQQSSRRQSGATDTYEVEVTRPDSEQRTLLVTAVPQRDRQGTVTSTFGVFRDITERKMVETYRALAGEVLQILNQDGDLREAVRRILSAVKARTGVDAVGLRLQDGEDFPYFAHDGFSADFLQTENTLVERGADGGVCRDCRSRVRLECTCGLVISGKTDPSHPLFTPGGSFWTNDSFPLLALPFDLDPRHHPRNRCIHQGYASVALVPLRAKDRIVGLLQLNGRAKGRFSSPAIKQLESIAAHISDALMRKQAADVLKASEERHRILFESTHDALMTLAPPSWNFTACNRATLHLFKVRSQAEFTALAPWALSPDQQPDGRDSAEKARSMIEIALRDGSAIFEWTHRRADGATFPSEVLLTRLEQGSQVLVQAAVRDITARRRAEERLRQLHRAVEQSPVSIVITDTEGQIEYVNPHFEKATGYAAAEVLGRNPRVLKSGEQPAEFYRHLWATITAGREWSGEFHNRRKSGELFWEQASISPVRDEQGRIAHFIAVKEDITLRKQAEDHLLQSKAELQESNARLEVALARERELTHEAEAANRAKSTFLTSMSHELRTPLNVINGVAATLIEQTPELGQRQSLQLVLESGENLLGIIEEILDYSGLQAGQPRIETKPFELIGVVAQVMRLAGETARRKQLALGFSLAPNLPARVVSDPRRLQQVLLNLVNNALKFTERGRVHLHCSARSCPGGRWRLSFAVSDTGNGISPEELARLFRPFARGSGTGVAQLPGSGLGLVISRAYANLLGGDIAVRSRPGRGSVFRCTIEAGSVASPVSALAALAPPVLRGRCALIVVKDHRQRRFLAATARAWQLSAEICSGTEATTGVLQTAGPFSFAVLDPAAVRAPSGDLARWLAPGAPGHTVPVAWLHRYEAPPPPETAAPSLDLPHPLDLQELARALAAFASGTPPAVPVANTPSPPAKLGERIPLRILAADDIRTNREMLRMMLHHLGYAVTLVEHGGEALAAMQQQSFDLILLDVQMPVIDGHAAAREICRLRPDPTRRPKLVAITANALPGDREKCLAAGMDDYLTKPVHPKTLEACFVRLFQSRRAAPAEVPAQAAPEFAEAPWVDFAHLESLTPGLRPARAAETLAPLHLSAVGDFEQIWPQVLVACEQKDPLRLAELVHGLKGCFLMLGWSRVARRCVQVLGEARRNEFAEWDRFPTELEHLFCTSAAVMADYLATLAGAHSDADKPARDAETVRRVLCQSADPRPAPCI
jgi:PAS domain S-box-containing protein